MVRPMGGVCDWLGGGGGGERRLPRCLTPCASRAKSLKSEIDVTFVGRAVTRAFAAVRTSRGTARGVSWVVLVIGREAVAGESAV